MYISCCWQNKVESDATSRHSSLCAGWRGHSAGDLALRHNSCAVKWARVKGDNVCDICKQPIKNLPDITPRATSEPGSDVDMTGFDDLNAQNHPHGLHGKLAPHFTHQCLLLKAALAFIL